MGKPRAPLDPVADLKRRLGRAPKLAPCVRRWWDDHGLGAHPATVGKRVALALIEQRREPDKRAGISILIDRLGDQLRVTDLPAFAKLFDDGHLAERAIVDAFAKVLVALMQHAPGRGDAARAVAEWRTADTMWQRRAACLAFAKLAPDGDRAGPGFVGLALVLCATVVWSHERFDQAAVGVLLRELSRAEASRVAACVRRYALLMSRECVRLAVTHLAQRTELLAHHKRATSLRHR